MFENVFKRWDKAVAVQVDVTGFLADAEAGANCFGFNCVAETLTITDSRADLFTTTAYSESLSAASDLNGFIGVAAPVAQRVFWCVFEGLVAIALLLGGGLASLQAAAIVTGLPFAIVLLLMCYSTFKGLRTEPR